MHPLIILIVLALLTGFIKAPANAAEESVVLKNGDEIKLYYFEPTQQVVKPRLVLLIAGGSNNEYMAQAQYWIGKEMVNRGWAIAVPISPSGRDYFIKDPEILPELLAYIESKHELQQRKPLLLGVSSGGSAALEIAANNPSFYSGVIAAPGRIVDASSFKDLGGLPVYLRIGEKDNFRWQKQLPEIVSTLEGAGADVDAGIVPDAKHLFQLNWLDFDLWLNKL